MFDQINVRTTQQQGLVTFLEENDFVVESLGDNLLHIKRGEELPVFINLEGSNLYFEVDLGGVAEIGSQELFYRLLDLNTEILPVSVGIDTTNADDPRLVLVESRETSNLDNNELLSVFTAFEIAAGKTELALSEFIN